MDAIYYGFAVLLFAAVILLVEGCYLWWNSTHGGEAQRISRRLRLMSGGAEGGNGEVSILKQRRYSKNDGIDRLLHKMRIANAIDRLILQAGVRWSVSQFIVASAAMMLSGLVIGQVWAVPVLAKLIIIALLTAIPYGMLRRARRQRLIKIEQQLPEAADFIARALRSGHSFTNVLQMVGSELPEPLCGEFRAAHEEINYGVPLNEALHNLADRIPLTDLRYLVIAVLIQRESGGNLAEILHNISHIIRERLKLVAQVRVLSAEGRMSAWILGLLPFVVIVLMSATSPKYISLLWTDPTGVKLLWYGAGMILIGVLWLRRVIHIRI
ncbi:type II secretion system F family protein [Massilia sp. GCM10020059]|uniref:Type II secretion system F family protein n=1 Tax=Massilia agrisoli TaxID=2892444 RepID=A0ABS8IS86_9BURK|nr:type II secretion system F family protein [Massilia agrisoli]MCC6070683.1 type II secretion system F family protein [Massilia agrisoli]